MPCFFNRNKLAGYLIMLAFTSVLVSATACKTIKNIENPVRKTHLAKGVKSYSSKPDRSFYFIDKTINKYLDTQIMGDTSLLISLRKGNVISFSDKARYIQAENKWFIFSGFTETNPPDIPFTLVILNLKDRRATIIDSDSIYDFRVLACQDNYLLEMTHGHYGNYGNFGLDGNYYKKFLLLNSPDLLSPIEISSSCSMHDYEDFDKDNLLTSEVAVGNDGQLQVASIYENKGMASRGNSSVAIQNGRFVIQEQSRPWNGQAVVQYDSTAIFTLPFLEK